MTEHVLTSVRCGCACHLGRAGATRLAPFSEKRFPLKPGGKWTSQKYFRNSGELEGLRTCTVADTGYTWGSGGKQTPNDKEPRQ